VLQVTVDGAEHTLDGDQTTILSALQRLGVDVPAACDDPRLEPAGACRLCIVQVDGRPQPVTACTTAVVDGMAIDTRSDDLQALRHELVRMLALEYPQSAPDSAPDKPFHVVLRSHDVEGARAAADPALVDDSHPYIHVDMNQCITCFRCARICADVQGQFTWQVWERGAETKLVPDSGTTLADSSCVACGACVDTCPTGALEDKSVLELGTAEEWTRTVCPYCGVGCEMDVGTRNGRITTVRPALDAPVNKGHLCVKGRYAHGFVDAPDRVTSPMIRRADGWEDVSWEEATTYVAGELGRMVGEHGPESVAVLGSARATNEDNYLAQKFARVVLGTNNVDCCARVCHTPSAAALSTALGTGASTNSFDDIERARTIVICGTNTTENHPIVGARIKQAKLRGTNLVVIDPRQIELAGYADVHLAPRPGTNVALFNALAHVIVEEDLVDQQFLADRVDDVEAFRALAAGYNPEEVAALCGVDAGDIRRVARLYATETPSMCFHGLGITEHEQGTDGVTCLINLALLTGNVGKPGTGVNPLRGQNNVQGSAVMGCEPNRLTGSVPFDESKDVFETVWNAPIPAARGLDATQMVEAAGEDALKGLWVIGWDVLLTNPQAGVTGPALGRCEHVIVQDLFLNETAREVGTVFLPACSSFEHDGTFMNSERRIQRIRTAVEPWGESKPDWEIMCLVAQAMGKGDLFPYHSAADVWEEIRKVWPAAAGITYDRLDDVGLQWPCPTEDHPGTDILHRDTFAKGRKRAALRSIPFRPTSEAIDEEFPFVLTTGRGLYQFNAGTMTMRTPNSVLRPTDLLEISGDDARRLGIDDGAHVRVTSKYGEAVLPAEVTTRVHTGQLFATFSDPATFVNRLTGPQRDPRTHTPQYKVTAVRLEPISPA
jgi:formate dehydrogenase major subunit